MKHPVVSRILIPTIKLALGLGIVGWLLYQAQAHQKFGEIVEQPKNWPLLGGAVVAIAVAVFLGFLRWFLLVEASGLPFSLRDAVRLGSLGFALNFVGPGGVGGDVFKSVALAREHHRRRSEAVATVIVDRAVGLLSLLAVASFANLVSGNLWNPAASPTLRTLAALTVAAFVAASVTGGLLMAPGKASRWTAYQLTRIPFAGRVAFTLLGACQRMSRRPDRFFPALALGLVVHVLLVLSFYAVAKGLPLHPPTLAEHMQIVPLAETAGVLPLTPGGLGTTEAALAGLYKACGATYEEGVIVALGQKIAMLIVGMVAIGYYFVQRSALQLTLRSAESSTPLEAPADPQLAAEMTATP